MSRQVFLENWQEKLLETIEHVDSLILSNPSQSPESDALLVERQQLGELLNQVRDVSPVDRKPLSSYIVFVSVHETLQFSGDFMHQLSEVYDIYRRFRNRLAWRAE
jgi:hypothetical protein